ncbi:MAG: DUF349 domain-containing protein [Oscillospiraceae bacterium]|nr:DUF349 domain-containing protein [Candidatus Limimonas coprohippi]
MSEIQNPTASAEQPVVSESQEQLQNEVITNEEQTIEESVEEIVETTSTTPVYQFQNKEEVLNCVKELLASDGEISRQQLDSFKSSFYHFHKVDTEEAFKKYIEEGGDAEAYQPQPSTDEIEFKELMIAIREKRASQQKAQEEQREANLAKKMQIIDKIKVILEKPDDVNKSYKDFKALQQEWNETGEVPATQSTDIWRTYQQQVEQFYDTLKLNNEFRAYDFKKNLEVKTQLCEAAEKLSEETDVVSAFRKLQLLHQQFREVGPVARELREEIWERFKNASTVINKRHQDFFEGRKAQEQENLEKKTAICEEIESINLDELKTFADWNKISEQITELQAKWKTIGFAPQKHNVEIYERFRAACDNFFGRKVEYFKEVRSSLADNLKIKRELCEKAEALKDSTEWKTTTDTLIELQKKWKETGAVAKKYSDELWKRFNTACDAFFEAKKAANSSQFTEQKENLSKKKNIIERLKEIATPEEATEELRETLKAIQQEWNEIGHVPFKEKDKIFKAFRAEMDRFYAVIGATATRRRVERFKNELKSAGADKLRDRLARQYDILKNEIKTYENNLGFLNLSSKSKEGNSLVDELNRKVDKLRAELDEIKLKIKACDQAEEDDDEEDENA